MDSEPEVGSNNNLGGLDSLEVSKERESQPSEIKQTKTLDSMTTQETISSSFISSTNLESQSRVSGFSICGEESSTVTSLSGKVLTRTVASRSTGVGSRGGFQTLHCTFLPCTRTFNRPAKLLEHLRTHTGERPFRCTVPGCTKDYKREDHLNRHLAAHSISPKNKLGIEKTNSNNSAISESAASEKEGYYCSHPGCDKYYLYSHHLKRHERIHKEKTLLECTWENCDFRTAKKNKLHNHMCRHQGILPYPCTHPGCSKSFPTPNKLAVHALLHIASESYLCGYKDCSSRFTTWKELNSHISISHPYTCSICEKVFTSVSSLASHRRSHASDDLTSEHPQIIRVRCPYNDCTSSFREKKNLMIHIRTIHEKREVQNCPVEDCGKAFLSKGRLKVHMRRMHSEDTKIETPEKIKSVAISKAPLSNPIAELISSRAPALHNVGNLPCPYPACPARYHLVTMLERHLIKDHNINTNIANVEDDVALEFADRILYSRDNFQDESSNTSKALDFAMLGSNTQNSLLPPEEIDFNDST